MTKKQIVVVVVDDSAEMLELIEMALASNGYRVHIATDAVRGFELVRRERPQVLLTDIMLGVTNGLELITRIRSDVTPPLPTMIAMSGFSDVAEEALRRGASRFLPKPFDVADVLDAVAEAAVGKAPTAEEVRRVTAGSKRQRAKAAAAANLALDRIAPRYEDLRRRGEWTVNWLPGYLGFGHAYVAILRKGRIRVFSASKGAPLQHDEAIADQVPLVRDIVETSSSLVLSGTGGSTLGKIRGFFAGVPVRVENLAIGAFCVVDSAPHALAAEDYEIIQFVGRRTSGLLAGDPSSPPPWWTSAGLVTPEAFHTLLSALLRRCQAVAESLYVMAVHCTRPSVEWHDQLALALGRKHCGIADGGAHGRYLVVAARPDGDDARLAAARSLADWAQRVGAYAGMVTVDAATVGAVAERELTRLADAALHRARARRDDGVGRVERFAIGRAAPLAQEAASASGYDARNGLEP